MAILVYERAIHVDEETGELSSYWPEYWPLEVLAERWRALGSGAFAASYQNDPSALQGNLLQADWLTYYPPEELDALRASADTTTRIAGVDPTRGGQGRGADYFACVLGELHDGKLYLTDFFNKRLPVDHAAQFLEDWLKARGGITYGVIEDISARGYVWNDLQNVNDGRGSAYNWLIERVQSRAAVGSKEMRFLAMAPRFRAGQVKVPGAYTANHTLTIDPRWAPFFQQWTSFPSGHDDLLDAAYWCQYGAFTHAGPPVAVTAAPQTERCPHYRNPATCYDCNSITRSQRTGFPYR